MARMVRLYNLGDWSMWNTDMSDRTTEEAQGGKAVGVDPSLITACEY